MLCGEWTVGEGVEAGGAIRTLLQNLGTRGRWLGPGRGWWV